MKFPAKRPALMHRNDTEALRAARVQLAVYRLCAHGGLPVTQVLARGRHKARIASLWGVSFAA